MLMMSICNSLLTISLGLSSLLVFNAFPARSTSSDLVVEAHTLAQNPDAITKANWQQHPKIKAVRGIVESVNDGLKSGTLKVSERKLDVCEEIVRKLAVDSDGVVRRYEKQWEAEDLKLTFEHYYDEAGRLRFVFISGWIYPGPVKGSKLEHRIYLDETGKRIWEQNKFVEGPGAPAQDFMKVWPDEQKPGQVRSIQKSDPARAFSAPCQE